MYPKAKLGCFTTSGIIGAIITILFISGSVLAAGGTIFSPGPLNARESGVQLGGVASHAALGGDCAACHAAIWDKDHMSDRCLACHTNIDINSPQSFHGVMKILDKLNGCLGCHTEHKGPQASIIVFDTTNFPHEALPFSLKQHQKLANGSDFLCSDCHGDVIRKMDLARCTTCHQEIDLAFTNQHVSDYGGQCLNCHDGLDRFGKNFSHPSTPFALVGKHAQAACVGCHSGAAAFADFANASPECSACHLKDDAHAGSFGQNCGACHTPQGWKPASFDHSKSQFPLVGKHMNVACDDCHKNNVFKGTPTTCYACHSQDDDHQGQFGQDCSVCHTSLGWEPATVDHARFNFVLTGAHTRVECEQCHRNSQFKGTPTTCYGCHSANDAHKGQFGQECAGCHTTTAWKPATFDHSKSIFPLTGQHISLACTKCHANNQFKGTSTLCASCHQEPAFHLGLFASACETCHTTNGWIPASFNQAHTFPLNHPDVRSCRDCHTVSLSQYTCFTCHEQTRMVAKHSEEGIRDITNCVKCHAAGQKEGGGDGGHD